MKSARSLRSDMIRAFASLGLRAEHVLRESGDRPHERKPGRFGPPDQTR